MQSTQNKYEKETLPVLIDYFRIIYYWFRNFTSCRKGIIDWHFADCRIYFTCTGCKGISEIQGLFLYFMHLHRGHCFNVLSPIFHFSRELSTEEADCSSFADYYVWYGFTNELRRFYRCNKNA